MWKKNAGKAVKQSFKKCCISNALNGTEDDVLWENCVLDCPV
jgi:hypothetical protein